MADESDCMNALATLVGTILYPLGVSGPTALSPINGALTDIQRGWPIPAILDGAMVAGQVLVTVFKEAGMNRLSGGNLDPDIQIPPPPLTLAASVAGNVATFSGTCAAGQLAGVEINPTNAARYGTFAWTHAVAATDTPLSVAGALAL